MEADIRATRSIGASGLGTDRCQRGDAIGAGKFRADINRSGQALDIAACHAVRDRRQIVGRYSNNWRRKRQESPSWPMLRRAWMFAPRATAKNVTKSKAVLPKFCGPRNFN